MLMRQRTYVAVSSVLAATAGAGVVFLVTEASHPVISGGAVPPAAAARPSAPQQGTPVAGRTRLPPAAVPSGAPQQPALAADIQPPPGSTPTATRERAATVAAVQGSGSREAAGNPAGTRREPASPSAAPSPSAVPASQQTCPIGVKVTVVSVCASIGG